MGRPPSENEVSKSGMILKFNGELREFLTAYAEQHQFRSLQELLSMLVRQYAREQATKAPANHHLKLNSRRINYKPSADLEEFLAAQVEAYDFTSKPELVKQIAREFFQRERKRGKAKDG
jgi:hypothetical protein